MSTIDFDSLIDRANNKVNRNPADKFGFTLNAPFVADAGLQGQVGLEIEVEAANRLPADGDIAAQGQITRARWVTHQDGSLRGVAREYVLSVPCTLDELSGLCEGLYDTFKKTGSTLDLSNRCSTHVHVNMSGRRINHVTSVLLLWSLFEESIIDWSGEERKTNHFCLSFKDSPQVYQAWRDVLLTGNSRNLTARNLKYSALNIMPLVTRGSVEFRCGRADNNPDFPVQFATLVASIVDHACEEYENPSLIANHISERGAYDIFTRVCERRPTVLMPISQSITGTDIQAFNKKAFEGFRRVQELCYVVNWNELLKEIKRPFVPNPFGRTKPKRVEPANAFLEDFVEAPREVRWQDIAPPVRPAPGMDPGVQQLLDRARQANNEMRQQAFERFDPVFRAPQRIEPVVEREANPDLNF